MSTDPKLGFDGNIPSFDLSTIRSAAEAATPGPWQWVNYENDQPMWVDPDATFRWSLRTIETFPTRDVGLLPKFIIATAEIEDDENAADRTYIATMDPQTTLALCDLVQQLGEALMEMREAYASKLDREPGPGDRHLPIIHADAALDAYRAFLAPSTSEANQ